MKEEDRAMQRATKDSQPTATVAPRWPFQFMNKEVGDTQMEVEKEKK